ncbi:MAG TPA: hypothetical protein VGN22_13970, partial [Pseudonocardia sp.]
VTVALTGGRTATVTELRFHADDAAGLVATVRAGADVIPGRALVLNRAVAVAEVDGPQAALGLVDDLGLDGYHLFHAIRADLLRRLGRDAEAAEAYEAAIARTRNDAEREFLRRRRRSVGT